jgi:hypothetical protein
MAGSPRAGGGSEAFLTLGVKQAKIDGLCAAIARGGGVVCDTLPGGQLGTRPLLTATPVVSHSPHRCCNNFTGSAGKIVIFHRRRLVSGYLLVQRTLRRLPLSLLREVFVFFFLGHELSPLMFGRYHSQTLIPQTSSHRSFSLGRKTLLRSNLTSREY